MAALALLGRKIIGIVRIGRHVMRDPLHEAATGRLEKRPPKAHVTIARPKIRPKDADRACGLEWAQSLDLTGVSGRLDRIALYTWHEERPKRLFRIVAERKLG